MNIKTLRYFISIKELKIFFENNISSTFALKLVQEVKSLPGDKRECRENRQQFPLL